MHACTVPVAPAVSYCALLMCSAGSGWLVPVACILALSGFARVALSPSRAPPPHGTHVHPDTYIHQVIESQGYASGPWKGDKGEQTQQEQEQAATGGNGGGEEEDDGGGGDAAGGGRQGLLLVPQGGLRLEEHISQRVSERASE